MNARQNVSWILPQTPIAQYKNARHRFSFPANKKLCRTLVIVLLHLPLPPAGVYRSLPNNNLFDLELDIFNVRCAVLGFRFGTVRFTVAHLAVLMFLCVVDGYILLHQPNTHAKRHASPCHSFASLALPAMVPWRDV